VKARFEMPHDTVESLKAEARSKGKINPTFEALVTDSEGDVVARVTKLLSVRVKAGATAQGG
jgi:hypothetical protein